MNRIKICLITNMYPSIKNPYRGIFVKRVEQDLVKSGNTVDKVTLKNYKTKLISYLLWWAECYFKILFQWKKYDIIYAHFVKYSIFPFLFLPKKILKKTVFNFHGTDLYTGKILKFLMKIYLRKSSMVIAPSAFFKSEIKRILDIGENQIFIYPSGGVNTELYKRKDTEVSNSSDDILRIGFVSSILRSKGWPVLLDALILLDKKDRIFSCLIVGSGNDEIELKEKIESAGFNNHVECCGRKEGKDLIDFLNALDVFAFPSERESLGLVGLEALSCGVPVIGSDIGGIKSYLTDGVNGYVFEPGNPDDFCRAICKYDALTAERKSEMSIAARSTAEKYDSKKILESLMQKFVEIQNRNRDNNH